MFRNPLLLIALTLTGLVALWGIIDTAGLAEFSSSMTRVMFTSRGWFVMLSASLLLILCIGLAISSYGKIATFYITAISPILNFCIYRIPI